MKLKDFGSSWRHISVHAPAAANGNISVNVTGNSSSPVSQNNISGAIGSSKSYVTRGQTFTAAGRTYLIAYHLPAAGLDLGMLLQAIATKTAPTAAVLNEETMIPLALLDVSSMGSLDDIRPFDLKAEISDSENLARTVANALKVESGKPATNAAPAKSESTR